MNRALAAMLAIIAVGSTAALVFELRSTPVEVRPPVPIRVGLPGPQRPVDSDSDGAVLFSIVLARPLFSPSRRPTAAVASAAGFEMPRLTGIIIDPVERRAIFAAADKAKSVVVKEGGALGEWSVRSIANEAVTLASPSGIRVLHLGFEKPKPEPGHQAASPPHQNGHAAWAAER